MTTTAHLLNAVNEHLKVVADTTSMPPWHESVGGVLFTVRSAISLVLDADVALALDGE